MLLHHLHTVLPHADVIVNTVPAPILQKEEIDLLREDALPLDVASFPYGFDCGYAASVGKPVHLLPSIPGRYFPVTAGSIIADTILNIMEEEGLYIP